MLSLIEQALIILASVIGAALTSYLGFLKSGEEFNRRKFLISLIQSVFGGLLSAFVFQAVPKLDVWVLISAALNGAGVDMAVHRVKSPKKPNNP